MTMYLYPKILQTSDKMTFRSSIASRKKLDGKLLLDKSLAPKFKTVYIAFKFKNEPYLCMAVKSSEKVVFFCSILLILMLMYRLFPVAFVALWFSEVVKDPRLHLSKIIVRLLLCLKHPQQQQQTVYNQSSNQCLTRSEFFTNFLFLYPQFLEVDLAL